MIYRVSSFTHLSHGWSVSGVNSQDIGGKCVRSVGNGLPAALPHASPRLEILVATYWCFGVTPRAGYPRGRYPGKALVLEIQGVKVQVGGVLVAVGNED